MNTTALHHSSVRLSSYFLIFAISGAAGLIYESIWTHYLKLFLGHAAYAQTLVLVIFMGGMAIGSALSARFGHHIGNALLAYAVVEGLIGLAAIVFHPLYTGSVNYVYDSVFPTLPTDGIYVLKWSLAAVLILPQSILLGATFPLMSAGILRRFPQRPGRSLAFLYFNNSIGAAVGVLLSGYVFIPTLGLPGTIQLAGVLNISLAAGVAWLSRQDGRSQQQSTLFADANTVIKADALLWLMVLIAAGTGAASFMYEIAWIRMLSMVLGSTTHAFELMLSAFILGLAIGGFAIRYVIDKLQSPLKTLALIQLAMGSLAATTLFIYGGAFDIMGYTVRNLDKIEANYWLFNVICHGIALLVMLPATICAGMTLPLITYHLIHTQHGESAIGNVYASNTLGAICGIVLTIQWLLPKAGLKALVLTGAGLDIVLGMVILSFLMARRQFLITRLSITVTPALAIFAGIALLVQLDPLAMASGVYTTGEIRRNREMIFLQDGKTSSISFFRNDDYLAIATNGKIEAAISDRELAKDEPTMILLGLLPLALHPHPETVATIGIGSGLTSHSVLLSSTPKRVDTIEIEPAMVAAAQLFGDRVKNTFADPRSNIHIEDAKAFFTTQGKQYDVIISEPSNPWISGVAGLFSKEFYRHVGRYLAKDGMLVQWIHLYHIDLEQIASVVKALAPEFNDYEIYALNLSDIAIVATKKGQVPALQATIFQQPNVAQQLQRLGIYTTDDLAIRQLGSKQQLEKFFAHFSAPANSDFAPYLDYAAAHSRFLQASATNLLDLSFIPKATRQFVGATPQVLPGKTIGENFHLPIAESIVLSQQWQNKNYDDLNSTCTARPQALSWMQQVHHHADLTLPYFSDGETQAVWQHLQQSPCLAYLSTISIHWLRLYSALSNGDPATVIEHAAQLFPELRPPTNLGEEFLVAALLAAHHRLDHHDSVRALITSLNSQPPQTVVLRFVLSAVTNSNRG